MENYFYKCEVCGYVHIVPAYWVSFSPEEVMEVPHICPETGQCCENVNLHLMHDIEQA